MTDHYDDYQDMVWNSNIPTWEVTIDSGRVQRIAAWVDAFAQGNTLLADTVATASRYLHHVAVEAGGAQMRPSSEELWDKIADVPVPPLGRPRG